MLWIGLYVVEAGFLLWVAVGHGADRIANTWLSFFMDPHSISDDPSVLRTWAWIGLIASTIWFAVGLFSPGARPF
ncbi:MAG: hypothetical protein GY708_17725 [Actinomycetia bacterium]|nr:hypothetical protein [Actinomycetes bacterium]